jgi:hypothetical protein
MTHETILRVRIIAYVCEGGVVHDKREEGVSTFSRMFRLNPDGCRYAVVGVQDKFHVYDIFDCKMGERGDVFLPGRHFVFPTEDAAIAAAALLPATDNS